MRASYAIDGGSPTVYVYSNVSYQSTSQAYRSPTLPYGQHTLTVTNLDSGDYSLYLDFFLFFTADETTSAPSSSTSSTTTTLTSASSTRVSSNASGITQSGITSSAASGTRLLAASATGSSSGLSSSSMPSPSSPTNPNNTNQIPLIVGPVIGAIVVCSFIFFLLRRRQKQKGPDSPSTLSGKCIIHQLFQCLAHEAVSAFNNPVRFPPITHLANGQKPSSLLHDSSEPPPYVQDLRPPSDLLTPNRLPAKFRGG